MDGAGATAVAHGQRKQLHSRATSGREDAAAGSPSIRPAGGGVSNLQPVRKASAEVGRRIAQKLQQVTGRAGRDGKIRVHQLDADGSGIVHTMNRPGIRREHQRGIEVDRIGLVISGAAIVFGGPRA